jgi:hypothetical protein
VGRFVFTVRRQEEVLAIRHLRHKHPNTTLMAGNTSREAPALSPNNQQHYSKDTVQTRRLRLRHSARHESSKALYEACSQHGSSSSITSQIGISRATSSVMSHSDPESFSPGPRLTKTGRISKAKKGVRDAHTCGQCGKVRANRSCRVHVRRALSSPSKNEPRGSHVVGTYLSLPSKPL